jgi:hypothetical protein
MASTRQSDAAKAWDWDAKKRIRELGHDNTIIL